ncbi:MAG TPA: hypothetical protein VMI13_08695 [Solirubrobacteraceae bacterium]|nr:hypothetical protein [Solirubrobacteraceae bacterium]
MNTGGAHASKLMNIDHEDFNFAGHEEWNILPEQELDGIKFQPQNDWLGWLEEREEIVKGEKPPHVLIVEACGTHIEAVLGERCAPPLDIGLYAEMHNKTGTAIALFP